MGCVGTSYTFPPKLLQSAGSMFPKVEGEFSSRGLCDCRDMTSIAMALLSEIFRCLCLINEAKVSYTVMYWVVRCSETSGYFTHIMYEFGHLLYI